jgi:hypothetical protein
VLAADVRGLSTHKRFSADQRALRSMPNRPGGACCA